MKKKLLIVFSLATLIVFGLLMTIKNTSTNTSTNEIDKLREQHIAFLNNSPFEETLKLSRKERKAHGVPPGKYFEEMWSLTLDPATGRPHPERVIRLQETLKDQFSKVPGETTTPWVERGPDNVGGRTRAIMFDPNDATNKRVFAGGVSGGLWVNEDITDANSAWSEVDMPQNLGISCITYDPNDLDTFYVGTGESYVAGDVNGNGLWKSTDGGVTWTQVFGGIDTIIPGTIGAFTVNSPANIAGDYGFVEAGFGSALGSFTGNLVLASDGTASPTEACNALTNGAAINGNIAVIQRGGCEFGVKVLNAENAGAVAVIVINNVADAPIVMGPGAVGASVTIPSFMISQADGAGILTELGNSVVVNISAVGGTDTFVTGISHINDVVVRDNGGISEVFVAASDAFFRYNPGSPSPTPRTTFGNGEFGLFKSVDAGANWNELVLNAGQGNPYMPNDIEIAADNKVWVSTINSITYGDGGGRILSSSDGTSFIFRQSIAGASRTQIAVSGTNPGTVYAMGYTSGGATPVQILKTTNEFVSETTLALPNDIDGGIPANDFTNTQGWYDIFIGVDPTDDDIFYVGGINLFKSNNNNWTQISEAYTNSSINDAHPDQHAIAFGNNDPSKLLFGNDGGVYYSGNSGGLVQPRNKNYNTLQFYKGAIGPDQNNEKLLAGAQDNNSLLLNNATPGINSSIVVRGGDGAFCFIDRDQEYMIASSQNGNVSRYNYTSGAFVYTIAGNSPGQFINPAALDSDNNILYNSTPNAQFNRHILGASSVTSTTALTNGLLTGAPTAFKTSTFTTTTLFVGTSDGKLLRLTNANASPTWADITGPAFVGSISCIELGETESDIYVSFFNYGVTSVFYSDDAGTTWQNKEGDLPDFPTRAILANPLNSDEVIVGTELGVWASPNFNDATPNWYQAQNGMKDVKVTSFDLRTFDNTVLATTFGRGMFTGQFTAAATSLSVDEFAKNELIRVYPTVSNGNVTISPNSEIREGTINVFDINGRNVHTTKVNFENGLEQPVSLNLSSGMYIMKFAANGLQSTHKIIIE
ncbi:MAG: hypothetical protein COA67_04410 [Lutibacter sp.]|nr:MAG: hypothetical protein COA67_04410 [Lutibacter sp.]